MTAHDTGDGLHVVGFTAAEVNLLLGALADKAVETDRYLDGPQRAANRTPCCDTDAARIARHADDAAALTERLTAVRDLMARLESVDAKVTD